MIKSAGGVVVRKTVKGYFVVLLYKNNHWVLPKGRVEKGETEKETAIREVYEETKIPVNELKIIAKIGNSKYIHFQTKELKTVIFFLIETKHKKIFPIKEEGFKKAEWFGLEKAVEKATFPGTKRIIIKAIKLL
jgi:bis(5'-nucleosidyl)-tetraphosphatase